MDSLRDYDSIIQSEKQKKNHPQCSEEFLVYINSLLINNKQEGPNYVAKKRKKLVKKEIGWY